MLHNCQAYAWLQGRTYVVPEDIQTVAVPVMAHRCSVPGIWKYYFRGRTDERNLGTGQSTHGRMGEKYKRS